MLSEGPNVPGFETGAALVCTDRQDHGQAQSILILVLCAPRGVASLRPSSIGHGWPCADSAVVQSPHKLCTEAMGTSPTTSTTREASARAWAGFLPNTCVKGRVPGVQRGGYFHPGPRGLLGPEQREAQIQDELPGPRLGKPSQFWACRVRGSAWTEHQRPRVAGSRSGFPGEGAHCSWAVIVPCGVFVAGMWWAVGLKVESRI